MLHSQRIRVLLAGVLLVPLLSCGDIHDGQTSVTEGQEVPASQGNTGREALAQTRTRPEESRSVTSSTVDPAAVALWNRAYMLGLAQSEATASSSLTARAGGVQSLPGAVVSGSTGTVNADYHSWPDWSAWQCVGRNEQGAASGGSYDTHGDGIAWGGSPAGGEPGSGYPGGLGISVEAWNDARDEAGVAVTNGAYASPADQIRVGRVIVRRHGWHAWAERTVLICGL